MPEREVKGWAVVDIDGLLLEFGESKEPLVELWMPSGIFRIIPARVILEATND